MVSGEMIARIDVVLGDAFGACQKSEGLRFRRLFVRHVRYILGQFVFGRSRFESIATLLAAARTGLSCFDTRSSTSIVSMARTKS